MESMKKETRWNTAKSSSIFPRFEQIFLNSRTCADKSLLCWFGVIRTDSRREFLALLLCEIKENESSCNTITPTKFVTKPGLFICGIEQIQKKKNQSH